MMNIVPTIFYLLFFASLLETSAADPKIARHRSRDDVVSDYRGGRNRFVAIASADRTAAAAELSSFWDRFLEDDSLSMPPPKSGPSVLDVMAEQPDISIFHSIVLSSPGAESLFSSNETLTVFAPIDDALEKFDQELITRLIEPEWRYHLQLFLSGQIVYDTKLTSDNLTDGVVIGTITSPNNITVSSDEGRIFLSGEIFTNVEVIEADLNSENGVVHKVSDMMLPQFFYLDLVDEFLAYEFESFMTMFGLLVSTGLDDFIRGEILTILWPADEVFEALPNETLAELTDPDNEDTLREILQYHMIPGLYTIDLLSDGQELVNVQGLVITFSTTENDDGESEFFFNDVAMNPNAYNYAFGSATPGSTLLHSVLDILVPPEQL